MGIMGFHGRSGIEWDIIYRVNGVLPEENGCFFYGKTIGKPMGKWRFTHGKSQF